MTIKGGFNDKPLTLRFEGSPNGHINLWLVQEGLPEEADRYRETLSYMTLDELHQLQREIQDAVRDIFTIPPLP